MKGTFRLTELVTDKKGPSKFHSYKQQEGILFYFILEPSKRQAGIHSLSEDGNSINNYSDISAVSTAFSSTCCSSRETSGQKLMASHCENHETSSKASSSKGVRGNKMGPDTQ